MLKFVSANAVLVARDLNVSQFQQLWFVTHEIVRAEEFVLEPGTIFAPIAVNFSTKEFGFLAVSERVQVTLPAITEKSHDILRRIVGGFAKALNSPSTFPAMGFNFAFNVFPDNAASFAEKTREMFLSEAHPWSRDFAGRDARFGGYTSRDFVGFRQKIECLPVAGAEGGEALRINHNFHVDISTLAHVEESLAKWGECSKCAQDLSNSMDRFLDPEENKLGTAHA